MKSFIRLIFFVLIINTGCSQQPNGVGCTYEIDWIPQNADKLDIKQSIALYKDADLEILLNVELMTHPYPQSSLRVTNLSDDGELAVSNFSLDFLIEDEILPPIKVVQLSKSLCDKNNRCNHEIPLYIKELVLMPNETIRLDYYFDYEINKKPEKAEAKVRFLLETKTGLEKLKEESVIFGKYTRRYNCILGTGHTYRKIE